MTEKLKREFIELLEKDIEFRYTVAGYLGLSEILKRLDKLEEGQKKLFESIEKLWESHNRLWESHNKLLERHDRLWESHNRLWESHSRLVERHDRLWESHNRLWESHNRLWEEVKALRIEQERMRKYMISGFHELREALGVTFETHVAAFLQVLLVDMGYPEARVEKKYFIHDGEIIEINIFCEKPLIVGEATVSIRSTEEAEREIEKLLNRVEFVKTKYGEKPFMTILSVARTTPEASESLRTLTEKHGIKLVLGREIEEILSI